jgi:hypothetical protein
MLLKKSYKLILLAVAFSLNACSTTVTGMQFIDKSPRGIKAINVTKELDSGAYQSAELHCAKYSKVPRILKKIKQSEEYEVLKTTIVFECIRP